MKKIGIVVSELDYYDSYSALKIHPYQLERLPFDIQFLA